MTYETEVTADSPASWWRLNEQPGATSVADSGSSAAASTVSSLTFGVAGAPNVSGTGVRFPDTGGSNHRFTLTDSSLYKFTGTAAYTTEIWVETSRGLTEEQLFDKLGSSGGWGMDIDCYSPGRFGLLAYRWDGASGFKIKETQPVYAPGWVHLAQTYDGANWRLYINGLERPYLRADSPLTVADSGSWALRVGGDNSGTWGVGANFLDIDEPAVYTTALSATRILAHYNAGRRQDTYSELLGALRDIRGRESLVPGLWGGV